MKATELTAGMRLKLRDGSEWIFESYSQYFNWQVVVSRNGVTKDISINQIHYYLPVKDGPANVCTD